MKNFLMLLLPILFFSCQQKENKTAPVNDSEQISTEKSKDEDKPVEFEENKQVGDTILMSSKNERGSYIAEGSLDSLHPRTYVKFKIEELGELSANIIPTTGEGNIRFNQIIFPDNTSDGPFGMDLKIKLKQKGNHILVIGHSQMADNPFLGKFRVEVETKK